MLNFTAFKASFATTAVGLCLALPAYAQTASDATRAPAARKDVPTELEEIIVTAQRKEERLQDVPISITVFSQEQLSSRNIVSAGDLAKYTPSLATNSRFGGETTSFAIRGFTQEGPTSPSVAVYFGDVAAPRAQGGTTGGNGAGVGSYFDLQNVQVLRGPQGTLFGRNTTGGAVLLVPQKPTHNAEGYVETSLGNYDLRRIQGVLNAPLSDSFRVRLAVDSQSRDGYLKSVSGIGPQDFADINYTAVRLSVVADLTPNLENYTIASYSVSDTNGYIPKIINQDNRERDPFPALRAAQIAATSGDFYAVSNGLPNANQKITQAQLINTTTWAATDTITIKNILSYARYQQAQAAMIYGENGYQNGTTLPWYAVAIVPPPGEHNASQQTYTEELQLQGRVGDDKLTYQIGGYYERSLPLGGFQETLTPNGLACSDILGLQCTDVTGRGGFISQSRSEYHFRNVGAYAQATYKITSNLNLTAGVRNTWDKSEGLGESLKVNFLTPNTPSYSCINAPPLTTGGTSAQIQADPSRCDFRREVSSSEPTWMVNLDYKPTDDVMVYGKYARGYRQGGINVTSYGLETWKPEKVDLYELGAKTSWQGVVPGSFNVAVFYNDFSNQQIAINALSCQLLGPSAGFVPACASIPPSEYPASAQGIGNGGKSTIEGVEVDASVNPFAGFNLNIGYAYLDTKLESLELPPLQRGFFQFLPNAIIGGPMSLTPRNKYTATASYTLPVDESIGRITLSSTFTYQDGMFGNPSSIVAPGRSASDHNGEFLPLQRQLNLNLGWTSIMDAPIDLALFVTNVTQEKFIVNTTGASFGWDAAILNEPRMFGARLKYRFGG